MCWRIFDSLMREEDRMSTSQEQENNIDQYQYTQNEGNDDTNDSDNETDDAVVVEEVIENFIIFNYNTILPFSKYQV